MTSEKVMAKLLSLKRLKLPPGPKVAEIRFRPYIDSLGDEAWRLWVILDEEVTDQEREWSVIAPLDRTIRDTLLGAGVTEFPYIQYVKNSELVEAGIVI